MTIPHLSKSRFLAGLQCHLRLWYKCYEPELASKPTPAQQLRFDTGHEVGALAWDRYPGGKLIDEDHHKLTEAMRSTEEAVESSSIPSIYEATFAYDDVLIRADILERAGNGAWNLIEVKSGASEKIKSLKDKYLYDVAVQHYVLSGMGFEIRQAGILDLNKKYVYKGEELDVEGLLKFTDLKEDVVEIREEVPTRIAELKGILKDRTPPPIDPSRHCRKPYACEFFNHCRKSVPEHWVMVLSGIRQKKLDELAEMGISDIRDIPDSFRLSALQTRIRQCVIRDTDYVGSELKSSLKEYEYPIHFLDFETILFAIPRYADTSPYQKLPFQWSDHILSKDGNLDHKEYLCTEDKDPREEVARTLLETLGDTGSICVYYSPFEKQVISGLATYLPHYRGKLEALLLRCRDLWAEIRSDYYHPEFHGSFSLKNVLPVLVPSMSYESLPIQDGDQAGVEYLRMIAPETPADEKERIRKDLLGYCGQDTLAMVKIREELLKRCR